MEKKEYPPPPMAKLPTPEPMYAPVKEKSPDRLPSPCRLGQEPEPEPPREMEEAFFTPVVKAPRYKVMVKKEETPPRLPSPCLLGQEPEPPRQSFCGVKTEYKFYNSCGVRDEEMRATPPPGGIKLEKVDLNHSGRMATVAEVRENFAQLQVVPHILMLMDIVLLDGGKVSGLGYDLTKTCDGRMWLPTVEEGDFTHEAGSIIGEKLIAIET